MIIIGDVVIINGVIYKYAISDYCGCIECVFESTECSVPIRSSRRGTLLIRHYCSLISLYSLKKGNFGKVTVLDEHRILMDRPVVIRSCNISLYESLRIQIKLDEYEK